MINNYELYDEVGPEDCLLKSGVDKGEYPWMVFEIERVVIKTGASVMLTETGIMVPAVRLVLVMFPVLRAAFHRLMVGSAWEALVESGAFEWLDGGVSVMSGLGARLAGMTCATGSTSKRMATRFFSRLSPRRYSLAVGSRILKGFLKTKDIGENSVLSFQGLPGDCMQ